MITTRDRIGYIRRQEHADGTFEFRFIEARIKEVRIGKNRTSVYSDRFRALDADELEDNTQIMSDHSGLVLVGEPFITNAELSRRIQNVVAYWNEHGAESILGERYEPTRREDGANEQAGEAEGSGK